MLIDTGATSVLVKPKCRRDAGQCGRGRLGRPTRTQIADGTTSSEKQITIHQIRIGRHVLYSVAPGSTRTRRDAAGLPRANQMGRFTIDTANNLLIFG